MRFCTGAEATLELLVLHPVARFAFSVKGAIVPVLRRGANLPYFLLSSLLLAAPFLLSYLSFPLSFYYDFAVPHNFSLYLLFSSLFFYLGILPSHSNVCW